MNHKIIYPQNGAVVDTHTPLQNTFIGKIRAFGTEAALEWLLPVKEHRERSYPQDITLRWTPDGAKRWTVEVSETPDFAGSVTAGTAEPRFTLTNPKVGQTYFWRVDGGEPLSFSTLGNTYRFIRIDGLMNVRDIGGIRIRQGMVYRGSEITGEYEITDAGRKTFCEALGIRTEVSLRKELTEEPPHSAAGETVRYKRLPYRPYREVFEDEHRENICRIFDFLADAENYPVYFHCLGGADRTGMIALYLRALAGESDEEILIDYELTSLSAFAGGLTEGIRAEGFRSRNNDYFAEFLTALYAYAGEKRLEKAVRAFLLDCGVPEETLNRVVSLLRAPGI